MTPDSRSGIDEHGDWTPVFPGQRPPFERGHDLSVRHEAYSRLRLQPRAETLRDELAGLVPFGCEADLPLLDLVSFTLAQVERAALVLALEQERLMRAVDAGEDAPQRLDRLAADSRAWVKTAARLLDALGLSPTSRARLGVDVANVRRSMSLIEYWAAREAAGVER